MMSESRWFRLKRNQEAERLARFLDDDGIERDGRIIERNDRETGGQDWRAPHEWNGGAS